MLVVEHTISMGHRLPSYPGVCASPHGHNVRIVVDVETMGFVDFKVISGDLRRLLEPLDHAMVLHERDPLVATLRTFTGFRLVILNVEPTTEALAQLVFNEMSDVGYTVVRVTVHETAKYAATATHWNGEVRRL